MHELGKSGETRIHHGNESVSCRLLVGKSRLPLLFRVLTCVKSRLFPRISITSTAVRLASIAFNIKVAK